MYWLLVVACSIGLTHKTPFTTGTLLESNLRTIPGPKGLLEVIDELLT